MNTDFEISGKIVDIINRKIFSGKIIVRNGYIYEIIHCNDVPDLFILPGFVDAHVHIESSMVLPSEFARAASIHGTVAAVADPHEIANVLGVEGVDFFINNASKVPFDFCFGAPSCVPATSFETSGASLNSDDIESLFADKKVAFLSEVMNFPGVINNDPEVLSKIAVAHKFNCPIDGHAPAITGDNLKKYIEAGITTDHECMTLSEAKEKIAAGMKILIREGSACKNFEALHTLVDSDNTAVMFCSDDKHPDDLKKWHINDIVRRSIKSGCGLFNSLSAATLNPVLHYGLNTGLLRIGDKADFIVTADLRQLDIIATYIGGVKVAERGTTLLKFIKEDNLPNKFQKVYTLEDELKVHFEKSKIKVIGVIDGEILTKKLSIEPKIKDGFVISDTDNDILKIVVVNRYVKSEPSIGFIKGFGIKSGAMATSVAHDSHNILALGTDDSLICKAINDLIDINGGLIVCDGKNNVSLPLPIAGILSERNYEEVASDYEKVDFAAKNIGSILKNPFMTLSFMALLVVPHLKIGDKGLFDTDKFEFTGLFNE